MSIVKILVPIRGDGKGENVLAHAAAVARRHNAHIEAVHCRTRADDLMPFGVVVTKRLREQLARHVKDAADSEEASLRKLFAEAVGKYGLEIIENGVPPHDRPTAAWFEEDGRQMDVIKSHGRLADLVAVAKPDRDRGLGFNTLKAGLFHTGRPVMLCPPAERLPEAVGRRIAIAWNGSTQAARAVALALPLIQGADEVVVLDGGATDHGAGGEELMRYLEIRGVAARRQQIDGRDNPGRVILESAGKAGADLLVMGAYSRSREYEAVFGGATQHVVDHCTIPVVMVH